MNKQYLNKKTKEAWDLHAGRWKKDIKKIKFFNRKELEERNNYLFKIIHSLKGKKKILDAGCGFGANAVYAALLGHKVIGLDFSEKNLHLAKEYAKINGVKLALIKSDVRSMPFKNKSFDVIISGGVIEHFPETEKAIKEHARVLKKGGLFVGHVPQRVTIFVLSKLFLKSIGKWSIGYEKSFSTGKFKRYLEDSGFKLIKVKRLEIKPGIRSPLYGEILRLLDKPLWLLGFGGAHFAFLAIKK